MSFIKVISAGDVCYQVVHGHMQMKVKMIKKSNHMYYAWMMVFNFQTNIINSFM